MVSCENLSTLMLVHAVGVACACSSLSKGTATWCGKTFNQVKGLFYTLCQFHNPLEIEFLDVYNPSQEEKEDPGLYSRNVQHLVARALGLPPAMQSLEDNFIMAHGHRQGLPFSSSMVVYSKTSQETGLHYRDMMKYLTRFAEIDSNKDGWITVDDMATFLGAPADTCLQTVFSGTETDEEQKMSFRQYLYTFVARPRSLMGDEALVKSAFDVLDSDGDGVISSEDFSTVLSVSRLVRVIEACPPGKTRKRRRNRCDYSVQPLHSGRNDSRTTFNFDQFKSYLESNLEYLLLFHGTPAAPPPAITSSTKVILEVQET